MDRRLLFTGILLLVMGGCCGRRVNGADDLSVEAKAFVEKHSTEKAESLWMKKWEQRCAEYTDSNPAMSAESFADQSFFGYLVSQRKKFEENAITDAERLEVCRWYLLYQKNQWALPDRISAYMTRENYSKWFLNSENVSVKVAEAQTAEKYKEK